MKNGAKLITTAVCLVMALSIHNVYAVEDFSFDLDAAINNVDKTTGETTGEIPENTTPASKSIYNSVDAKSYLTETNNLYYEDALVQNLIAKYRAKNYVGCIQEAQSKIKLESPNPVAMYYMALAYTQIGDVNAALELYDNILKLNPGETLSECVIRGRDCLTGGPACPNLGVDGSDVDEAVNEYKSESVLLNLDTNQTGAASPLVSKNIISAETPIAGLVEEENQVKKNDFSDEAAKVPTNDEVLKAVKTLQDAGIAVTFQPGQLNNMLNNNPEMAQLQMMMGGNNSNNNGFDMLPYMMMQSKENTQYNPQMVQAMMMNYMLPNLSSDKKD